VSNGPFKSYAKDEAIAILRDAPIKKMEILIDGEWHGLARTDYMDDVATTCEEPSPVTSISLILMMFAGIGTDTEA